MNERPRPYSLEPLRTDRVINKARDGIFSFPDGIGALPMVVLALENEDCLF